MTSSHLLSQAWGEWREETGVVKTLRFRGGTLQNRNSQSEVGTLCQWYWVLVFGGLGMGVVRLAPAVLKKVWHTFLCAVKEFPLPRWIGINRALLPGMGTDGGSKSILPPACVSCGCLWVSWQMMRWHMPVIPALRSWHCRAVYRSLEPKTAEPSLGNCPHV
jgi:hypothetical protein